MGLLEGKNIVIMGLRNKWSIAWGIAEAAYKEGANLIVTYQGEREEKSVSKLVEEFDGCNIYQCDISNEEEIDSVFEEIKKKYNVIHGLVHAIAHANTEDLQNPFIQTSKEGFTHALEISSYSLIAVARKAKELMTEGGSILTLTYMGSEKVFPGYNIMGVAKAALESSVRYLAYDLGEENIRVNAISAGPVKTLSAKGVKNFSDILTVTEEKTPLKKRVDLDELGGCATFYLSELSKGITGEITYVDCGYNIMGF